MVLSGCWESRSNCRIHPVSLKTRRPVLESTIAKCCRNWVTRRKRFAVLPRPARSVRNLQPLMSAGISNILHCSPMETKTTSVPVPAVDDLLEVKKPTSLLIAQFFLFPLIIIAICVGIFLLFGYLTYEQKSPQEYLNDVRNGSELCCRWQSAYELSNIISTQKEKLRNTDFVNDIVKVYQTSLSEDPRVRRYLALTMGHLGDPRAIPALVEGLNDTESDNQIYDMWALGSIGDSSAVPEITKKLEAKDPAIRRTAAYVLGALKDSRAAHALTVALNDSSDDVQWN